MKERNTITREIAARHQRATKKQKSIILYETAMLKEKIKKAKPICQKKSKL